MSVFAGKTLFYFEPKMAVNLAAVAQTETPTQMQIGLGPLSQLSYKPATFRYLIRLSAATAAGAATLELKAGGTVLKSIPVDLTTATVIEGQAGITLAGVAGEAELSVNLNVTTAADAGTTATVDTVLAVEQPTVVTGC
ncbi:MAG: hypothetical protein R3303_05660 [Marinobacter sp.]|nr:hypothetical protein [Marinobacter sp.]